MACFLKEHSVARFSNVCFRTIENVCAILSQSDPPHTTNKYRHMPAHTHTNSLIGIYSLLCLRSFLLSPVLSHTCVFTCHAHECVVLNKARPCSCHVYSTWADSWVVFSLSHVSYSNRKAARPLILLYTKVKQHSAIIDTLSHPESLLIAQTIIGEQWSKKIHSTQMNREDVKVQKNMAMYFWLQFKYKCMTQ